MKKNKTLVILLLIPFVIGLLTFVSVVALTNNFASYIEYIIFNYQENEGFRTNNEYLLEAEGHQAREDLELAPGNNLVWEIVSYGENSEGCAVIEEKEEGEFYLVTSDKEGDCLVRCRTENKQVKRDFRAHIYDNALILINPVAISSGSQIDETRYYGEYDVDSNNTCSKTPAEVALNVSVFGEGESGDIRVGSNTTSNVSFNSSSNVMTFNGSGNATLELETYVNSVNISATYSFNIVSQGYNVYDYLDLLACTNRSSSGEIVCLQTNLQSLANTYRVNRDEQGKDTYIEEYINNNTKLFGIFDFASQSYDFSDLIYYQDPKLETKFIDQFLASDKVVAGFNYSTQMKVGIRAQKDIYGNGFTINMNDLAYPNHGYIDATTGKMTPDRTLDYFFGPLTFVSIGDIETMSVIRAYLCDNVGLLLDGDNITLNDIKVRNANNVDNMYNLTFTGTVVEVQGDNVTVKNSIIENGRTCLRAFSTDNLLIDNCLLQNAAEFIVKLGSNRVNSTNHNKEVTVRYGSNTITADFEDFYNLSEDSTKVNADNVLTDLFWGAQNGGNTYTSTEVINALNDIQEGLDNYDGIINSDGSVNYDAHITINDSLFYNSGIYSIALESAFNGAYLYNGMPGLVSMLAEIFGILPNDVGGTSFPVELTITGDTRFYDYQNIDSLDITALIEENFSTFIGQVGGGSSGGSLDDILGDFSGINIDSFFPLKAIIKDYAIQNGLAYRVSEEDGTTSYYVNRPIAWYGGGYNASTVHFETTNSYSYSDEVIADLTNDIINGIHVPATGELLSYSTLAKCVIMAIGTHPFKFIMNGRLSGSGEPEYFNEVPNISYLTN